MRGILLLGVIALGCGGSAGDGDGDGDGGDGLGDIDGGGDGGGGGPDDLRVNRSGTRIKMRVGTTPDGAKTFLGWHDAMRGDNCLFTFAADGQQRCVPSGAYVATFYADSGCTQPLGYLAATGCSVPPAVKYAVRSEATCTGAAYATRVYPVTGRYTGIVYTGAPGNCSVLNTTAYWFFALGGEIAPSTFQALTETVE